MTNDTINRQISIFDGTPQSKLEQSLRLIREFEQVALARNPKGYIVGYSGGKDSDVLVDLFIRSGVKFAVIHNHTTLDAPETVYHIRKKFAEWENEGIDCKIYYPEMSFWQLCLKKKMLPLRQARFCCAELKERDIPELRFAVKSFGVRKAESVRRKSHRDSIEIRDKADYSDIEKFHFDNTDEVKQTDACYTKNYFIVNPIAYWTEKDIWDYHDSEKLEFNPLYDKGFNRVGCIGCPMARRKGKLMEFAMYPKYRDNFIRLCDKILAIRKEGGYSNSLGFKTGIDMFEWYISN